MSEFKHHFATAGRVVWIGIRPEKRGPMKILDSAQLEAGYGIVGDHRTEVPHEKRQLSLIQYEDLAAIAALANLDSVQPEMLRRNLVVAEINLLALIGKRFHVGNAILEGTGPCHPCARMERNLGYGAYNAMCGYGGISAVIHDSGSIEINSSVSVISD